MGVSLWVHHDRVMVCHRPGTQGRWRGWRGLRDYVTVVVHHGTCAQSMERMRNLYSFATEGPSWHRHYGYIMGHAHRAKRGLAVYMVTPL